MKKFEDFKQAIRNPPPERLAKVEYQSHFFQMLGISIVCIVLIIKGLWWVIFAFIFGLGVSYSAGMSAFIKYTNIMALLKPEDFKEYEKDKSPTRRRSKIIYHVFGSTAKWVSIFFSTTLPLFFIQFSESRVTFSLAYVMMMAVFFILFYFFLFYWAANAVYQKEVKGE